MIIAVNEAKKLSYYFMEPDFYLWEATNEQVSKEMKTNTDCDTYYNGIN